MKHRQGQHFSQDARIQGIGIGPGFLQPQRCRDWPRSVSALSAAAASTTCLFASVVYKIFVHARKYTLKIKECQQKN
jgi:hypothetical protein